MTRWNGAAERAKRLYELLKHERFWCDTCHGMHPLAEHATCRAQASAASAARARQAITPQEDTHAQHTQVPTETTDA